MLESITWQQYFLVTGLVVVIYYGVIIYRRYGKRVLTRLCEISEEAEGISENLPFDPKNEEELASELLAELELLVNYIRANIFEKAGKQVNKAVLLEEIKAAVASFNGLHKPAYRNALNNFIIRFGDELCGTGFSEEELEAAWESLLS